MSEKSGEGGTKRVLYEMLADLDMRQQRVAEAISGTSFVTKARNEMEYEYQASQHNGSFVARTIEELAVLHSESQMHSLFAHENLYKRHVHGLRTTVILPGPEVIAAAKPHIVWSPLLLTQPKQREAVFPPVITEEEQGFDGLGIKQHSGPVRTELIPISGRPYGMLPFFIIGGQQHDDRIAQLLLALPAQDFSYLRSRTSFFLTEVNAGHWRMIQAEQQRLISAPTTKEQRTYYNPEARRYEFTADAPGLRKNTFPAPGKYQKISRTSRQRKLRKLPFAMSPPFSPFYGLKPSVMKDFQVLPHLERLALSFGKLDVFSKLLQEYQAT